MGQAQGYEGLIRELLAGVEDGWNCEEFTSWLATQNLQERDLAQWLREHGAVLWSEDESRYQLIIVTGLSQGELAESIKEVSPQWKPKSEEWEECLSKGVEHYYLQQYDKSIPYFRQVLEVKPDKAEVWHKLGFALEDFDEYQEASICYGRAVEIKPEFHIALYSQGTSLLNIKQYEEAIKSFDRAININPNDYETCYYKGTALSNLERYEEAIKSFDEAISINPDEYDTWSRRGGALFNLGQYEETIKSYDQAIAIKPEYHDWHWRGNALSHLRRYEESIKSFDEAISINPDEYDTWSRRGGALFNLGQYEEAIKNYDQATSIKSDKHHDWYWRGIALYSLGRYEEAINSFDRAISLKPDEYDIWSRRSGALFNLGQYEETIKSYDQAIAIKPEYHDWHWRGITLSTLERYEEAIKSFDEAISINPDEYNTWSRRGGALFNLGQYEEAIKSYDQAISIKSDKHHDWYWRGIALYSLGRYEEAIKSFDKAISLKPDEYDIWSRRSGALFNLGQYEETIKSYDQAIAIKPEYHDWHWRGIALSNLEQYEEAIKSFDRAIDIDSCCHGTFYSQGNALCSLERYEKGVKSFEQAIKIKSDYHEALYQLGDALFALKKYEEAIESYNRAIEVKPDYFEAFFHRGAAQHHLEQCEKAIDSFNQAIEINPNHHTLWFNLGVVLSDMGRCKEALTSYDRTIKIKPDDYQAWLNRGVALVDLRRYKEAIVSYEQVIAIQSDFHQAWLNIGISRNQLYGYRKAISSYYQAFEHIYQNSHPEGWGLLQRQIGRTHYQEGINQLFNHRRNDFYTYYTYALLNYSNALEVLTREQFPQLRLETLIDTVKVHLAQHNTAAALQCKKEAFEIRQDLLNAEPTPEGKKRLQLQYSGLRHLDVDFFIASNDHIQALRAAELDKNNCLTYLLTALEETTISPSYDQMQQLLTTSASQETGIVYWHLSPDHLTTFILTANDSQPLIYQSDDPSKKPHQRRNQAQQLAEWIKEWDTQYRDYGSKKPTETQLINNDIITKEKELHPWRKNLPERLAQLHQILEIDEICQLLPTNLTKLILIPHGDLHRFPIHTFFLNNAALPNLQGCTYLPSIQIGLNLQDRSNPNKSYTPLLSVEDPQTHQKEMPFAQIESAIVRHLLPAHPDNTYIDSKSANLTTVEKALSESHASFHFTGHAAYNSRHPENSALALTDEALTAKRIAQLNLSSYNLVTLAACETAITGNKNIDTEYVGLTSAFLQAGAANIFSTLWQVDEIANAWFTIYFHQQLIAGKSPSIALNITQKWMQNVTWRHLADWLTQLSQLPHLDIGIIDRLDARIENTHKEGGTIGLNRPTKYSHPYYWTAFTLTGEG
jgi:tetratricopeptide (TPR) repeat protein/CHAT domain-containing protein